MKKKENDNDYLDLFMAIAMGVLGVVLVMLTALITIVFNLA